MRTSWPPPSPVLPSSSIVLGSSILSSFNSTRLLCVWRRKVKKVQLPSNLKIEAVTGEGGLGLLYRTLQGKCLIIEMKT